MADECLNENSPLVETKPVEKSSLTVSGKFIRSAKELKRSLGYLQTTTYVVGILLGSGIFISPSFVAKETSSMGVSIVIWIISGIICLLGALCFCELASIFKKAGGEYIFIKEIYGDAVSFFTIWAQLLIIFPAGYAFLAATIGEYIAGPFFETTSSYGLWLARGVAVLSLIVSFVINCIDIEFVGKSQVVFTVIQSLTVLFVSAVGLWQVCIGRTENYENMFLNSKEFDPRGLSLAFYDSLWAYDGWGYISVIIEEIQNPERNMPLAVMTGIPFVTICYVLINLAFMSALTQSEMASSPAIATVYIEKVLGKTASIVISFAAAISCFSSLNASICVSARALLSAAREGHLPEPISFIHRKRRSPIPSLLLELVLTAVWIFAVGSELQTFLTYFSFAVWLTYALAICGLIYIRMKQPGLQRPFKVFIGNPIFMCLISLYLMIAPFAKQPVESTICLMAMLSAFPIYYTFIYKQKALPPYLTNIKERFYTMILAYTDLVPCIFIDEVNDQREDDIL